MTTIEQKQTLQDVLRLDTVYGLLQYHERINVRGVMLGWGWAVLSDNVHKLADWLQDKKGFEMPLLRVGQDRITYVQNERCDKLQTINSYRRQNKAIGDLLRTIMNYK